MLAKATSLLGFLRNSPQFVIPIYQRTYSWSERECRQLWDDILRTGSDDDIPAHFLGSIVYIEGGDFHVTTLSSLLVIDGQQRLTTVMLILEALARRLGDDEPVRGFSAKKLRNYHLLNSLEDGEDRYKLLLTQTDKTSLLNLMQQKPLPEEPSVRIEQNFTFFKEQIRKLGNDLGSLCNGLDKLIVVDISLNRSQDNPQLIFESMNSTGRELSQADLIRNYVLMGLEPTHQTKLYEDHWRPIEIAFGQEAYGEYFDDFMRHYLTLKSNGEIPKIRAVYEAFKAHSNKPEIITDGIDNLVADIHVFAKYYCAMAFGKEENKDLAQAFSDLRELKVEVAFPLLLELYHDYDIGILSKEEFVEVLRLVEAYVFRRAVCAIPTNSLNRTFATFGQAIEKDRYVETVSIHFLNLRSYRRFPRDEEFKNELSNRDLYNFQRRSYWLRRLENHGRKERVYLDEYTIEHIVPQNENLSGEWQEALGPDWQRVQETWVHTLGNITLTGYNPEYGDRSFVYKRDTEGGFKESPLKLNAGLGELEEWNEGQIGNRAKKLADMAVGVWSVPDVDNDILEAVHLTGNLKVNYTLEDHVPLLPGSPIRPLFDAFQKEVMALDPCVTEEVRKLYVAYKAETNFVDVIPQKNRLRIALNMRFHELNDPKQICKDVTNIGRWGNGDVEVDFDDSDQIPYVMGLVRQSFEKQMGDGELDL
ncbi:MAG: DUF262 domain-containing protein [Gammaproteobacteria bacterium]|nr:DUF262 domain-containing protein [Gammaproteobacteria bacterium]